MPIASLRANRHVFIGGLGIGQICSWGSLYYSFPQLAEAIGNDLGFSKPALYGAATLGLTLSGLAAYPIGEAIDRGHGRAVMAWASVLSGLLLFAWSRTSALLPLYFIFAGIGMLQAATLYEPAFAVVARRFGAGNARAGITALTLWGGFASTVFIPLIELLLGEFGWRGTLQVLGAVNLLLCAGLYAWTIDPAADAAEPAPAAPPPPANGRGAVAEALRLPAFWALAVAFTVYFAAFSAFTFHIYPMLLERGFTAAAAVSALAVIGPAQVAGRVVVWLFAPGASVRLIGSAIVALFPATLLALALMPADLALLMLFAACYGAANGVMTIVRGMAVPEMLTRRAYGAVNGLLNGPGMVARAVAPLAAAALWAASGSYDAVLAAIVAGAVIVMLSFWLAALQSRHYR